MKVRKLPFPAGNRPLFVLGLPASVFLKRNQPTQVALIKTSEWSFWNFLTQHYFIWNNVLFHMLNKTLRNCCLTIDLWNFSVFVRQQILIPAIWQPSYLFIFLLKGCVRLPTILLGAGVNLLTADTVSCSGEGQHLDAVVGVFLQSVQLQWGLRGCDVPDLPELWRGKGETGRSEREQ